MATSDPLMSPPWWRLSLAGRLALGFAAIAVVLLLGHAAAQRNLREAISTLDRAQSAQVPLSRIADALTYRVAAFDRTVLADVRAPDKAGQAAVTEAEQELLGTLDSYATLRPAATDVIEQYREKVREHTKLGWSLIDLGARRQAALASMRDALDHLSHRIASAFGSDLTLPNLAFTRRAYGELELVLGRLRTAFNDYLVAGTAEQDHTVQAVEAFRTTLAPYRAELGRAPGRAWLELVDEDLGTVESQQYEVQRLDTEIGARRGRFAESGLELPLQLDMALAAPASRAVSRSAGAAVEAARSAEAAIDRLTYVVLGVTLLVSLLALLAVSRPVRRLTRATRALALGGRDVRVPPGGPSELDQLARSFNHMAEELAAADAAAKRHHHELEDRVRVRTRKLTHLLNHDTLTGLPNRRFAFSYLQRAAKAAATRGGGVALVALDVDNFKVVNDNLGHEVGDTLLRGIAGRLRLLLGERCFIARIGGDQFVILLGSSNPVRAATEVAERVINGFRAPIKLGGRDILLSVSIGVAWIPEHADDAQGLMRATDAALFQAKTLGRNRIVTFSRSLVEGSEARFALEQSLRRAIGTGELTLLYQPQVALSDGNTDAVEALLRWNRHDGPPVPATEFIRIAEQSGMIVEIGEWALETAMTAVAGWRSAGVVDARVAINVSVHQLLDSRFAERLSEKLQRHGLPAAAVELELTETAFQTSPSIVEALKQLRDGGLHLALDDFGTGYSSLTSLSRLPLRRVKIDKSLIADAPGNPRAEALARSIIGVCHGLRLSVTVEGVERPEQLAWLAGCGPVHAQGFLIGLPMPSEDIPEFVRGSPATLEALFVRTFPATGGRRPADPVVPFRFGPGPTAR